MNAPGWYGKMPGAGDFVTRRLPDAFVRRWDAWLEGGLVAARDRLGPDWLERYLVAPVVRFWVGTGVFGATWAGIVMPSVDRVGRHFPLTIAQPGAALAGALAARSWYAGIDEAARLVLHVDATVADLEEGLAGRQGGFDGAGADEVQLARELVKLYEPGHHCSVWWCGDAGQGRFHCFDGLPPAPAFLVALGAGPS